MILDIAAGVVALGAIVAALLMWRRVRRVTGEIRDADAQRDVAMSLLAGDIAFGVAAGLAASARLVSAGSATLLIADATGTRGLRAVHGHNDIRQLLHIVEFDDSELAALDAVTGVEVAILGGPDKDPRLTRFAAAAELRNAVFIGLGGEGSLRGLLALGNITGTSHRGRLDGVRALRTPLSAALFPGAPLQLEFARGVAAQREAASKTLHDPLTKLPTRALFVERLQDALDHREAGRPLGVIVIRLGGVMAAAERLGPDAGAEILGQLGSRLESLLRRSDVAARTGESEFSILLLDLRDDAEASTITERLCAGMNEQMVLGDMTLDTEAHAGVRLIEPAEITTTSAVLRDAASALSLAASGDGTFAVHDRQEAGSEPAQLLDDLRAALLTDSLTLHYQPIVDLRDGSVLGAEALVRWFHPERGTVPPMDFLPLAEDAGLAPDLGLWVLRQACLQLRAWQLSFQRTPPLAISVNIAAAHLADPAFAEGVLRVVDDTGVNPDCVILEFSEDSLQAYLQDAPQALTPLTRGGIHLAVDDVGTGHATLEYLRRMPVDILKIGRPFIAALADSDPATSTAHAIVDQGEKLRMSLVAEGVESADQVTRLRDLGCAMAQGYFLARPGDATAMETLLGSGAIELEPAEQQPAAS